MNGLAGGTPGPPGASALLGRGLKVGVRCSVSRGFSWFTEGTPLVLKAFIPDLGIGDLGGATAGVVIFGVTLGATAAFGGGVAVVVLGAELGVAGAMDSAIFSISSTMAVIESLMP